MYEAASMALSIIFACVGVGQRAWYPLFVHAPKLQWTEVLLSQRRCFWRELTLERRPRPPGGGAVSYAHVH